MSKKGVPDAWDDDWVIKAEQLSLSSDPENHTTTSQTSRAQRKAQHVAANKQLWESAENPQTFHYLDARSDSVPLKAEFKPQLQLLSRKPKPTTTSANGGLDEGDDSEEERRKEREASLAEKQEKAKREREEKQKKYAEARERLFGSPASAADSASARPGSPAGTRGKTQRGGRRGGGDRSGRTSRSGGSSADQSPARATVQARELFDPNMATQSRPVVLARRGSPAATSDLVQPSRQPKGPDGSGRGGFGFATRGNRLNGT